MWHSSPHPMRRNGRKITMTSSESNVCVCVCVCRMASAVTEPPHHTDKHISTVNPSKLEISIGAHIQHTGISLLWAVLYSLLWRLEAHSPDILFIRRTFTANTIWCDWRNDHHPLFVANEDEAKRNWWKEEETICLSLETKSIRVFCFCFFFSFFWVTPPFTKIPNCERKFRSHFKSHKINMLTSACLTTASKICLALWGAFEFFYFSKINNDGIR